MFKNYVLALLLLVAGAAQTAPFLVSNLYAPPEDQPSYFEIQYDGQSAVTSEALAGTGGYVSLSDDLALRELSPGAHTVVVRACSELWGCSSDSDPFGFMSGPPAVPISIRISISIDGTTVN